MCLLNFGRAQILEEEEKGGGERGGGERGGGRGGGEWKGSKPHTYIILMWDQAFNTVLMSQDNCVTDKQGGVR